MFVCEGVGVVRGCECVLGEIVSLESEELGTTRQV